MKQTRWDRRRLKRFLLSDLRRQQWSQWTARWTECAGSAGSLQLNKIFHLYAYNVYCTCLCIFVSLLLNIFKDKSLSCIVGYILKSGKKVQFFLLVITFQLIILFFLSTNGWFVCRCRPSNLARFRCKLPSSFLAARSNNPACRSWTEI